MWRVRSRIHPPVSTCCSGRGALSPPTPLSPSRPRRTRPPLASSQRVHLSFAVELCRCSTHAGRCPPLRSPPHTTRGASSLRLDLSTCHLSRMGRRPARASARGEAGALERAGLLRVTARVLIRGTACLVWQPFARQPAAAMARQPRARRAAPTLRRLARRRRRRRRRRRWRRRRLFGWGRRLLRRLLCNCQQGRGRIGCIRVGTRLVAARILEPHLGGPMNRRALATS